jgi:hypothetical protein
MTLLAERAAEEDVKEDVLLYSLLAKERVHLSQLGEADAAIERYLSSTFGIETNFDLDDALERLKGDGLVSVTADGMIETLAPSAAAGRIDQLWDRFLDDLVDGSVSEGIEYEGESPERLS